MDGYRIERWSVEQYMDDVHTQIIQPEPTVQRGWSWTKRGFKRTNMVGCQWDGFYSKFNSC